MGVDQGMRVEERDGISYLLAGGQAAGIPRVAKNVQ